MRSFIKKTFVLIFAIFWILPGWQRCDLPWQPGPMPSAIIETEFEPGLNILGVVRLEDSTANSFVYVERAYPPDEYDAQADTLPLVKDAVVQIRGSADTTALTFQYFGDLSGQKYVNTGFRPVAGETYHLTIEAPDLPRLTAIASVPHLPEIDSNSLQVSATAVSFSMRTTDDASMYDVYLLCENGQSVKRFSNEQAVTKEIQLTLNRDDGNPLAIRIFSYDRNLAKLSNYTSSIMPQSFLETVSTVENGYGCFGAVSVLTYVLPSGSH
ncbi:MAG: DUF4249 family protein [Candidatus Neomarinimicrobiota bacterium]